MTVDNSWLEASIYTTPQGIEAVCGMVSQLGFGGVEIVDEGDFLNFLENHHEQWDYVDEQVMKSKRCPTHIKVYLRQDENAHEQLTILQEKLAWLKVQDIGIPLGSLEVKLRDIDENSWFESWKKYFVSFEVGKNILIVPQWDAVPKTEKTVLRINPGMLFGTGTHHTTKLCMEMMEDMVKEGMNALDAGCGSGILSVLALLLGVSCVRAVDIDSAVKKIVLTNATANNIDPQKLCVVSGNILSDESLLAAPENKKYDLVVANIVADVIIPLSPMVSRHIAPNGVFLCSGIIEHRANETEKALEKSGFKIINKATRGEWYAYAATLIS